MSAEQNGPKEDGTGDDVRDGVRDGDRPVPKEAPDGEGTTAAGPPRASDGTEDSAKGTGPAEEEDSATPDPRGLTTDTSPGD